MSLNTIWGVKPKRGLGLGGFIRERFLSFGMVFTPFMFKPFRLAMKVYRKIA